VGKIFVGLRGIDYGGREESGGKTKIHSEKGDAQKKKRERRGEAVCRGWSEVVISSQEETAIADSRKNERTM